MPVSMRHQRTPVFMALELVAKTVGIKWQTRDFTTLADGAHAAVMEQQLGPGIAGAEIRSRESTT